MQLKNKCAWIGHRKRDIYDTFHISDDESGEFLKLLETFRL